MKKSWKESLYDVSCSRFVERNIPIFPIVLGLLSIVCCFIFGMVFDWMLLSTIFFYMFWIIPQLGIELWMLFNAVKSYKKETFLCNKIRNTLLANEGFMCNILIWTVAVAFILIASIIFNPEAPYFMAISFTGVIIILIFGIAISKPISEPFKRKIVYIENENTNVKDN